MATEQRRTLSRRQLAQRHEAFEELSPEVGTLDPEAVAGLGANDRDELLATLADAASATDPRLRALARSLAARLVLDYVADGPPATRGSPRLRTRRLPDTGGDVDVDASLEALSLARAAGDPVDVSELRGRIWERTGVGIALLVDRSGSMSGQRLATAAVAASAAVSRAGNDISVIAFADDAIVVKSQDALRPVDAVVHDLLCLRGRGTTDLALGLRAARLQLERSPAGRRVVILLSDCRATAGDDPLDEAGRAPELAVLAPADDDADADAFASRLGVRIGKIDGPSSIPGAFALLLER